MEFVGLLVFQLGRDVLCFKSLERPRVITRCLVQFLRSPSGYFRKEGLGLSQARQMPSQSWILFIVMLFSSIKI